MHILKLQKICLTTEPTIVYTFPVNITGIATDFYVGPNLRTNIFAFGLGVFVEVCFGRWILRVI